MQLAHSRDKQGLLPMLWFLVSFHPRLPKERDTLLCCPMREPPREGKASHLSGLKLSVRSHLGNLDDGNLLVDKPLATGCLTLSCLFRGASAAMELSAHTPPCWQRCCLARGKGDQQCPWTKEKESTESDSCPHG